MKISENFRLCLTGPSEHIKTISESGQKVVEQISNRRLVRRVLDEQKWKVVQATFRCAEHNPIPPRYVLKQTFSRPILWWNNQFRDAKSWSIILNLNFWAHIGYSFFFKIGARRNLAFHYQKSIANVSSGLIQNRLDPDFNRCWRWKRRLQAERVWGLGA